MPWNRPNLGPLICDECKLWIGLLADDMALYEYAKLDRAPKAGSAVR